MVFILRYTSSVITPNVLAFTIKNTHRNHYFNPYHHNNWHKLSWESEERGRKKKSVDKRGVLSDEAYTRQVLGDMANSRNLIVINDEAHHAWRINGMGSSLRLALAVY